MGRDASRQTRPDAATRAMQLERASSQCMRTIANTRRWKQTFPHMYHACVLHAWRKSPGGGSAASSIKKGVLTRLFAKQQRRLSVAYKYSIPRRVLSSMNFSRGSPGYLQRRLYTRPHPLRLMDYVPHGKGEERARGDAPGVHTPTGQVLRLLIDHVDDNAEDCVGTAAFIG